MKLICIAVLVIFPILFSAQINISFENEEGFTLGNINNQVGWSTFNAPDYEPILEPIDQQDVTNIRPSHGINSLKITSLETFPEDYDGFFGVVKDFGSNINFVNGTEISFDVYFDTIDASDYIVTLMNSNSFDELMGLGGIEFFYNGEILLPLLVDGEYEYTETPYSWAPDLWMNCKIKVEDDIIKYFVNNQMIGTSDIIHNSFNEMYILTDNYGGHMFIDNIRIVAEGLGTSEVDENQNLRLVKDGEMMKLIGYSKDENFNIKVFNSNGRLIYDFKSTTEFPIENLPKGVYFVNVINENNNVFQLKFLK